MGRPVLSFRASTPLSDFLASFLTVWVLRVSGQTMMLCSGLPVFLSQTTVDSGEYHCQPWRLH